MLTKKIHIPIFNQTLTVAYSKAVEFRALIRKRYDYDVNTTDYSEGSTFEIINEKDNSGERDLFLFINKHFVHDSLEVLIQVLSHEMVHVVDCVMDYSEIKNDPNNNETRAYLTGYLMKQVYLIIQDLKKST